MSAVTTLTLPPTPTPAVAETAALAPIARISSLLLAMTATPQMRSVRGVTMRMPVICAGSPGGWVPSSTKLCARPVAVPALSAIGCVAPPEQPSADGVAPHGVADSWNA